MNDHFPESGYSTGSTSPQKSKRGLLTFLLIIVILLCSIISVLSILNVRLFQKIKKNESTDIFSFSATAPTASISPEVTTPKGNGQKASVNLQLNETPQAVDNIPQDGGLSLQDIYSKAIPSVVSISCVTQYGISTGSGVVLSENGYIVTNAHVVEGARSLEVLLSDGTPHAARIVGRDSFSDLAVLYIEQNGLTPAEFGDDTTLRVGDAVVAIGDPLGIELRGTMTNGIISAINRDVHAEGRTLTLIQTNAALNQGNSGGPLLNCYGQVIGINTMKMGDNMSVAGVEGLGFAIPSTTIKEVVDQLLQQGYVSGRPGLGITVQKLSTFDQLYYGIPQGLYITSVTPGSCTANAGIHSGDVLLSFDGQPTADLETLQQLLYSHNAGDSVKVIIYRGGRRYETTLILDEAQS